MLNKIIEKDLHYITNQNLEWKQFKNTTILISGATGFLAFYMINTLLYLNKTQKMNIKIIAQCRDKQKMLLKFEENSNLFISTKNILDEIHYYKEIDYIIHMASIATPKYFKNTPVDVILPNVVGTNNLLELAKEKKVKVFLFFSTSGVYGDVKESDYPVKENCFGSLDPTELSSCYLESKRAGENLCIAYLNQFNVPIKIVRPSITYGPGVKLDDGRSYADFISSIVNKKDIVLFSDGEVKRNFCYVADAIVGFFLVLLKGKIGEAYNVATDDEISIVGLANLLTKEVFPELKLNVLINKQGDKNYLRKQFLRTQMDITKIKSLGWEINFDIKEGFKRTVRSYKDE